ncbi:MAG: hypothetical protein JSR63_03270 [Proteobacteria bacterium]|nr:hypothetical protein [Pseudomonadota bacterium]MBS0217183.1 hypothetical protein [Pseudomonadota bacterium]
MHARKLHHCALAVALLPALASCASASTAPRKTLASGASVTLQPGERVDLPDGSTLGYIAITADSRCPEKVQCIWAGDADLLFELAKDGNEARKFHLHTGTEPKSFHAGGHTIFLDAVTRGTDARATIRLNP